MSNLQYNNTELYLDGSNVNITKPLIIRTSAIPAGVMYSQNSGTVTDLNNLLQSGCYRINDTETNRPADWCNVIVAHGGGTDTVAQIACDPWSSNMWFRGGNNYGATWGSWRQIAHNGNSSDTNIANNWITRNSSGAFASGDHYLNNQSGDTPSIIFYGVGYNEWNIDSYQGRLRIHCFNGEGGNGEKLAFTPYTTTANESFKFTVPSVYTNTSSSGIAVVVDGDGGIRRQVSSIRYKTNVEDLQKEFVDTFFENARPIYYKDKHPQEGKDWGFWGFIAEEVAEFDKRLVHWRWDGEEVEVTNTKLDQPAEPERIEIEKEEIVLEDGTKEIVEREVIIPAKEATYKEYTTKEFREDRTKPMIAEGVFYDRITVLLTAKVQEQEVRISKLEELIKQLLNKETI